MRRHRHAQRFVLPAKALHGNRYDGHTLDPSSPISKNSQSRSVSFGLKEFCER